ncbi:hypothetical protein [Nostoc sp. PCC 9305]
MSAFVILATSNNYWLMRMLAKTAGDRAASRREAYGRYRSL